MAKFAPTSKLINNQALRGVDEFIGPAFFAGCGTRNKDEGAKLATWEGGGVPAASVPQVLASLGLTQQQLDGLASFDVEPLTGRAMRYALRLGHYARLVDFA